MHQIGRFKKKKKNVLVLRCSYVIKIMDLKYTPIITIPRHAGHLAPSYEVSQRWYITDIL